MPVVDPAFSPLVPDSAAPTFAWDRVNDRINDQLATEFLDAWSGFLSVGGEIVIYVGSRNVCRAAVVNRCIKSVN